MPKYEYVFVDLNVPLPGKNLHREYGDSMYPFEKMNVLDSFHIPKGRRKILVTKRRASAAIDEAHKKYKQMKFVYRTVGEEDPRGDGVRVWRVE